MQRQSWQVRSRGGGFTWRGRGAVAYSKASQHHQSYCEPGVEYSTQGPKTRILVLVMDDDGWWVDGWMDGWWMDGG